MCMHIYIYIYIYTHIVYIYIYIYIAHVMIYPRGRGRTTGEPSGRVRRDSTNYCSLWRLCYVPDPTNKPNYSIKGY